MSIASYQRNVKRRVTGPHLRTCYPSALEQISPYHSYRPGVYRNYREFISWSLAIDTTSPEYNLCYAEMMDTLVHPLGGYACEDVIFKHATTPLGMTRLVNKLLGDRCRVVVDIRMGRSISEVHAVGLLPVPQQDGFVTLVSNHVPDSLQGIVSIQKVTGRMAPSYDPFSSKYPFSNANVMALPAI